MDYNATMVIENVFFSLRLTHHDDDKDEVERVAEQLARRLGATYLYLGTPEDIVK